MTEIMQVKSTKAISSEANKCAKNDHLRPKALVLKTKQMFLLKTVRQFLEPYPRPSESKTLNQALRVNSDPR